MLAEHLGNDSDILGRWMAYHLAELISAAQDEAAAVTVEQRQQIVDTILKVWANRNRYPRPPMENYASVFEALDRLGDDRPWRFSGLFDYFDEGPAETIADLPLVTTAVELERLTRETLIVLIWRAAQSARDTNERWLTIADQLVSNEESVVTTTLRRLREQDRTADPRTSMTDAADNTEESGFTEDAAALFAQKTVDSDYPLTVENQRNRLHAMADILTRLADSLTEDGTE